MKKAKGVYRKNSARLGFAEWSLETLDDFENLIKQVIREGIEHATEEYECCAWFPYEREEPIDDPTTIYVALPIGPGEYDSPCWTFTLTELVDTLICSNEIGDPGGKFGDDFRDVAATIRDSLRSLADKIDERIKP